MVCCVPRHPRHPRHTLRCVRASVCVRAWRSARFAFTPSRAAFSVLYVRKRRWSNVCPGDPDTPATRSGVCVRLFVCVCDAARAFGIHSLSCHTLSCVHQRTSLCIQPLHSLPLMCGFFAAIPWAFQRHAQVQRASWHPLPFLCVSYAPTRLTFWLHYQSCVCPLRLIFLRNICEVFRCRIRMHAEPDGSRTL